MTDSAFEPPRADRWFLWGMPLSGKTSLGKKLRKRLPYPVFDLDAELEKRFGKTVTEIFATEGEPHFREAEAALLQEIVTGTPSFLIVTGGGTPCHGNNADFMLANGTCLFLHTPLERIVERSTTARADRPLLAGNAESRLRELYAARLPQYARAHAEFYAEAEALLFFENQDPDSYRDRTKSQDF